MNDCRRPPYGGRGLKSQQELNLLRDESSPSVWGAWIEMPLLIISPSLPMSPSVWGAWIEIFSLTLAYILRVVALRMGGVD